MYTDFVFGTCKYSVLYCKDDDSWPFCRGFGLHKPCAMLLWKQAVFARIAENVWSEARIHLSCWHCVLKPGLVPVIEEDRSRLECFAVLLFQKTGHASAVRSAYHRCNVKLTGHRSSTECKTVVYLLHERCLPVPRMGPQFTLVQVDGMAGLHWSARYLLYEACPLLLPFFRCAEARYSDSQVQHLKSSRWISVGSWGSICLSSSVIRVSPSVTTQTLRLLPPAFSDWFENVLVHFSGVGPSWAEFHQNSSEGIWRQIIWGFISASQLQIWYKVYAPLRFIQPLTLSGLEGRSPQLSDNTSRLENGHRRLGIISGTVVMTWKKLWVMDWETVSRELICF